MLKVDPAVVENNIADYWLVFSKWFRPWIHELAYRYKKRGDFPLMPEWLLPSFYKDSRDIEVAAIASLLIKNDDKMIQHVDEFRQMTGDSPYEWFRGRAFIMLSTGTAQYKSCGGCNNKRIALYFSKIYDIWDRRVGAIDAVLDEFFYKDRRHERACMLRMVLGSPDGIGKDLYLWRSRNIRCPQTAVVMDFLRTFFPDYKLMQSVDTAIGLFGFERDCDFFYAALGFNELQRKNPRKCAHLIDIYGSRYKNGYFVEKKFWVPDKPRGILVNLDYL